MNEYDLNKAQPGERQNPPTEHKAEPEPPRFAPPEREYSRVAPPPGNLSAGGYRPLEQRHLGGQRGVYSRPYDTVRPQQGTYGRKNQGQGTYQYNATASGWQQQGKPKDHYEWDFQEYDNLIKAQKRGKNRGVVVFAVSLLCILSFGLLALAGYNVLYGFVPGEEESSYSAALPETPPDVPDDISMNINNKPLTEEEAPRLGERMTIPQVARAVRPAVVGIVNYQTAQFYEPATEASGIIISADGYIVTNAHVVDGADGLVVIFNDNSELEAVVVGLDRRTDLAVIKVNRAGLSPAVLGNSDELEVGETVIAIGNPGGLELAGSVTRGIVSAVNRVVKTPYYSTNYIQTDAAINPGNSGGALCNEFGQVVGINTAKIVAEGYEGIGFAIPITEAVPIIDDLIKNGRVTGRVLLGITGDNISEIISRNRNVPVGVQITSISSEELTKRGVLRGDIITHIDDERIWDINDIQTMLKGRKAGDLVKLTLFRQTRVTASSTFEVTVPLIEDTGSG